MDTKDNLLGVLRTLFKWKKPIVYLCTIAAAGSIAISLFLPNYYQSVTTFYAASSDLAKPQPVGPPLKERAYYGIEEDVDRILSIASSNALADYLIRKFSLYQHYDIDSTQTKAAYKVRQRFRKLYEVQKTKYQSIELSVEDKDPQLAAAIANAARNKIEAIAQHIVKESQAIQLRTANAGIIAKEGELRILGDSLAKMREHYGIYDPETQAEILARHETQAKTQLARHRAKLASLRQSGGAKRDSIVYLTSEIRGAEAQLDSLRQTIKMYNIGVPHVSLLNEVLKESYDQLGIDKERYKQLEATYNNDITTIIKLEEATIPVIKSRPKRSIIVIASVLIAFLFSVVAVLLLDTYRDVNWKEIING